MLRKNKGGMALIFDALVFLTIISVVSVALMNAACVNKNGAGTGRYVDKVHEVALACTFEGEGIVSLMTIKDMMVLAMMANDTDRLEELDIQLDEILSGYLEPLYDYHHKVKVGDGVHCSGNENVLENDDIYVSTIDAKGENGYDVSFVLCVSFA